MHITWTSYSLFSAQIVQDPASDAMKVVPEIDVSNMVSWTLVSMAKEKKWLHLSLLLWITPEIRRCCSNWLLEHASFITWSFITSLGPNEISIRDVDSITPLMSPNGFEKWPCKWFTLSFFRSGSSQSLSVWSGRILKSETIGNQDNKYEIIPALISV